MAAPGGLPKVTLSDGRVIELNLYAVRRGDIMAIASAPPDQRDKLATEVYARVTGLTQDALNELPYPDWWALDQKVQKLLTNPLTDPN